MRLPGLGQWVLNCLNDWSNDMNLTFSASKTVWTIFTSNNSVCKKIRDDATRNQIFSLTLAGQPIIWSRSFRYLGVIFDDKLTWRAHAEYIAKKTERIFHPILRVARMRWGITPFILRRLYNAIFVPCLTYGAIVWAEKLAESDWNGQAEPQHPETRQKCNQRNFYSGQAAGLFPR